MTDTPFDLTTEVRDIVAPIVVLDVGAMALDGENTNYLALVRKDVAEVIGFEPQEDECQKLVAAAPPGHRYLPYALGDGSKRTLHVTKAPMTSSLYKPNTALLRRFSDLEPLVEVVKEVPVQTHRLDDVPGISRCDFAKIDVQGAELDVIRGGARTLAGALVVEAEVEMVPLYEGQPLFSDIDIAMRELGFSLWNFTPHRTWPFAPLFRKKREPFAGQLLWSDAIYFRDFMRLTELDVTSLLRFAVIAHEIYGARDFVLSLLDVVEQKGGPLLWDRYCKSLVGVVKPRPVY